MSTTTKFNMTKDIGGYNGFGLTKSNVIHGVLLAQNVAQSFTLPTDSAMYAVVFSIQPGANVFVNDTTTATAYTGTIGLRTSELNPMCRQYKKGTTISMITPDSSGAYVEAAIYVCQPYVN